MREIDISRTLIRDFKSLFPDFELRKETRSKESAADIVLEVKFPGKDKVKRLLCEVKAEGFPKYLRLAARQLKQLRSTDSSTYPVVITPYVSEEGRKICKEESVGFLDLSGNCFLQFDGTYIEVKGNPNKYPTERKIKSIYKGKSSRVLRVMLLQPDRRWTFRDLAQEAVLSIGQIFKVVSRLEELDFIERSEELGLKLRKPSELLNAWRTEYSFKENKVFNFYSIDSLSDLERKITEECRRRQLRYAMTLFSGASRVAPFTRYNQVFAYVDDPIDMADKVGWKTVESGANIVLLQPFDEGVYYSAQIKDDVEIVSTIQLYLDLYNYRGRGREQAEFIRSQLMKF